MTTMATPCEIVFIDECNFVNDGRRFFIDEGDEAEDEEEYEISETDSSDFSSEERNRQFPPVFQVGAGKKVRKRKLPKNPVENKQQIRKGKLEGRKISSSQKRNWTSLPIN